MIAVAIVYTACVLTALTVTARTAAREGHSLRSQPVRWAARSALIDAAFAGTCFAIIYGTWNALEALA
ncbi:hypothetical protein [Arsenicicoccus dermatophilus]|uniref:hypothetical protein n=1 Tax=Arsenicicoccus dermatophilus TaxID=1076331 RepID=UPI001F4CD2EF|nr:hypothetical protein [Arsenicicoccus dermatophilus]MCH8613453.1 hypothetical protein [Arsenicicoccus dermatophilus]